MEDEKQKDKVIEVRNVKKIYRMGNERITAVDDVSFEINKGEFCCLLGTSGSGKSTLLNLMAGIEKITSGQIIIKGKNIHKMSEKNLAKFRQKNLGFVFQSYNLMNSMTALENVEFPLVFKRVPVKKRKKMAREMLSKVGLKSRLEHKPKQMSGGQQQRVGIARAFVAKPEIVFADEPTGNLDSKTTMEVMNLIKDIAKTNNQTIVMVTHDRRLAEFADKIIRILDGKIQSIDIMNESNRERILHDVDNTDQTIQIPLENEVDENNNKDELTVTNLEECESECAVAKEEIAQEEIIQKDINKENNFKEDIIKDDMIEEDKNKEEAQNNKEEIKKEEIKKEEINNETST